MKTKPSCANFEIMIPANDTNDLVRMAYMLP